MDDSSTVIKASGKLFDRAWFFVPVAMLVFFTVSIVLSYRSIHLVADNANSISNTLEIINLIKDFKTEMLNAETGQRGFIITQDVQYLLPYKQALQSVEKLLDALNHSTTELPQQKEHFKQLYSLAHKKIDEMQFTIAMVESHRSEDAVARIKTNIGMHMMDDIRLLIKDMEQNEFALLAKNEAIAVKNRELITWTLLATNIFGLVLSLAIFFALYRNSRNMTALYTEIEATNNALESKVIERTHVITKYSEELQRSNRELEEFAFVASHDLQEPLRKIRAFGDRLQQTFALELGERGADYIERMQAASERMSILINDLLGFSRVSSQQRPFEPVDLNKVMAQTLDDLEYAIESSHAKIQVSELPTIDGDGSQLGQVFMNLIGNSLKFHVAGVAPVITVTCEAHLPALAPEDKREWCCLRFSDNGIGFEAQYAERIFNLFQRLHGRGEYSGTGIGLALCRKIIESHGGTIEAISELGKGAVFIIHLPKSKFPEQ